MIIKKVSYIARNIFKTFSKMSEQIKRLEEEKKAAKSREIIKFMDALK